MLVACISNAVAHAWDELAEHHCLFNMLFILLAVFVASAIALPTDGRRHQDRPKRIIIDTDLLDFVSTSSNILDLC